jgi:uncharacterized repeat protein (TIGR01451 family)
MGKHQHARVWFRGRGKRRVAALVASVALVGTGAVFVAGPADAAACTSVGGFEIDGNMDASTCAGTDWGTANLGVQSTTSIGTYQVVKDNSNPSGWSNGGGTPPKITFSRVYSFAQVVAGHYDAYVGWERESNTGTGGYAIEIDNAGTRVGSDGAPQPDRSAGGFVFYVTTQGAGAPVLGKSCAFTSQAGYPGTCTTGQSGYAAAINTAQIHDPLANIDVATGEFLEVALDITSLTGIAPSCPAPAAASLYLRSFTGENPGPTGNLKGYVAPLSIAPDSTCVTPTLTTAASGGAQEARGSSQHDVATLTGVSGRPDPTGSIAFYLCQPADVTAAGCPTGGDEVGSAVTLSQGKATSADSTKTSADGKYCWRAEYTPDSAGAKNYLPTTHTNATTECFTVVHASPTLTTQIAPDAATGGLGLTTLTDTATLHGFVAPVTGETITFKLYGPFAAGVTPTCDTTAVFTTTGALNAQGVAPTSTGYTPTQAGTYVWRASYPGDSFNDAAADACNETTEKITVVGATIDVTKSADVGTVSAGDTIGFTIAAENKGSIPALGTVITDPLPAGADLNWTIDPTDQKCSITGVVGKQTLTCTVGTLAGSTTFPVHISSPTTRADCGTVDNKATVTTTNGTGGDSDVASIKVNCAQLGLTKTADAASVNAGSSIGFTVTASNSAATGTGTAHGVAISDPLPSGSGVSWSIDAQTSDKCSIATALGVQTVTCTIGDLAPGATYSFHVTSSTAFGSCGDYKNVATLSASNANSIEKNATTSVLCSSLSLTKTADHQGPVDAGSQIGFTIAAANAGSGSATGAVVSDTLPTGVTWSIASGPASCSIAAGPPQVLTCTAVTLVEGQSESVHVVASTTSSDCAAYLNTATLSSTNSPSPAPASATETVVCPSLSLTKTADKETVDAGSPIGFTVTVTNSADAKGTATGVVIDDPLPAGTGVSWSVDKQSGLADCTVAGATGKQSLSCVSVSLAPGESESVHVTSSTSYLSCTEYANTATLTGTSNHDGATASASTTVRCPNLSITKTADAPAVDAGQNIGFTVTITNAGPGTATGVALDDPLPITPGLVWTIDSGPESCQIMVADGATPSQTLVCSSTDIGAEDSLSVHVVAGTVFTNCGTYDNTATFTATNALGDKASARTAVLCPDVSLVKSADATSVNAGESIGFSITVSNADSETVGTATGVTVHDPLPGGTGVNWSIDSQTTAGESSDSCSISGDAPTQVLDCSGVTLAPGESETVHVTSVTAFAGCATYDNTASAAVTNGDNPADASASIDVLCSELAVTKTADAANVAAGNPIGFTIHASNAGAGTAKSVTLTDKLPPGVDANWSISPDYAGPGTCAITGDVGQQTLSCQVGDLTPEATAEVHVVSATSDVSCATLPNTVTLDAANAPSLSASASTTVTDVNNCLGTSPTATSRPPATTVPAPSTSSGVEPVAATGAGPLGAELGWAAVLLGLGIALLALARRRRSGGSHAR